MRTLAGILTGEVDFSDTIDRESLVFSQQEYKVNRGCL